MPLKKVGPNYEDQNDTLDLITIEPEPPQASTLVTFTAASYGKKLDGSPHTLAGVAGNTSLSISVLPGLNRLVFELVSPAPQLQSVNIVEDGNVLETVSVQFHSGTGSLHIMGKAAPAVTAVATLAPALKAGKP